MTQDQFTGLLRAILPGILGYLAGKGLIPGDQVGPIAAALVTLGAAGWSVYVNQKTQQIAAVARMPEVQTIVADPVIADVKLKDVPNVVSK